MKIKLYYFCDIQTSVNVETKWTQQPPLLSPLLAVVSAFGLNINCCLIVIEVIVLTILILLLLLWLNFILDMS